MRRMTRWLPTQEFRDAVIVFALAGLLAGCGSGTATPIARGGGPNGFPLGTFTKEFLDPAIGDVRLAWTFAPDGRWSEVPFALDGRTLNAPPVRGTYAVDGEVLTIITNYPPSWGTSRHDWRLDGDRLWTTFVSSDVEADAEWFAMLDVSPWSPVE